MLLRSFNKCKVQCDRLQLGLVLLPWLVVALNALMAKLQLRWTDANNLDPFYRADHPASSLFHQAHAFRSDLFFGFIGMSVVIAFVAFTLPRKLAIAFSISLAIVTQVVLSVEMAASAVSGGFADYKMVWLSVWWTLTTRRFTFASVSLSDAIYCFAWFLLAVLVSLSVAKCADSRRAAIMHGAGIGIFLVALLGYLVLAATPVEAMPGSDPLLISTYSSLLASNLSSEMMSRSPEELYREYRHDAKLESTSRDPQKYFASARDYNVIFFIMETIPAQVAGLENCSLPDMPNIAQLRKNAFISERHFTTYPSTNCALFSMFTSIYIDTAPGPEIEGEGVHLPGLIRQLDDHGYETGFFGYVWKEVQDDRMLRSIGFETLVEPDLGLGGDRRGVDMFVGPVGEVERHDTEVLHKLKDQIHFWSSNHQKFAAVYFPEIAHDPWRNITGNPAATDMEKGHALAARHDQWMGEIVNQLKQDGALDHTIIVLTGDHGLRSVARGGEHPQLISRRIVEDISMHVPLLIYVPKVLKQTETLPGPTSHVDLPPTLLELLGIADSAIFEQGIPIWSPRASHRRIFLLMTDHGADAYYDDGSFYMVNSADITYRSDRLNFDYKKLLPFDSAQAQTVRRTVADHKARQAALVHHILKGVP